MGERVCELGGLWRPPAARLTQPPTRRDSTPTILTFPHFNPWSRAFNPSIPEKNVRHGQHSGNPLPRELTQPKNESLF